MMQLCRDEYSIMGIRWETNLGKIKDQIASKIVV